MAKIYFVRSAPKSCYLAFSGGVDSAVLLHSLLRKKVDVTLLMVDHNTQWCKEEILFTKKVADDLGIRYRIYNIPEYDRSTSLEAFWSRERDKIFQGMDKPVMTGHHLDDAVEWYVMTSCQGMGKIMNYNVGNVYRPMLAVPKSVIMEYANERRIPYLVDPTNSDTEFNLRNKIRHNLIPNILTVFPGIKSTVKKLLIAKINKNQTGNLTSNTQFD